jgi:hypothetical protein
MSGVLLGAPAPDDVEADAGPDIVWRGVLPFSPLRELTGGAGLRLQLRYDWASQLATWSLFNPMSFADGVAAFAAAVVKESGGGLRVAARAAVRDDDDIAFVDIVATGTTPTNITVRELFARVNRGAFALQLVAVSRVPHMSDGERASSLVNDRDTQNPRSGADNGSSGGALGAVVGAELPDGFLSNFGKYAGLVVGLGALVAVAYVARSFK